MRRNTRYTDPAHDKMVSQKNCLPGKMCDEEESSIRDDWLRLLLDIDIQYYFIFFQTFDQISSLRYDFIKKTAA